MSKLMSIEQVNQMGCEEFIEHFGNVIEHCSIFAAAICKDRPFKNVCHIHRELIGVLDKFPVKGKEGVLRSHPDLAGTIAALGQLTAESTQEQLEAGLSALTVGEKNKLEEMNERYKNRFGFPFVICARENKKDAILTGMASRLDNSRSQELERETGIEEVKKIAYYRLLDIVQHTEEEKVCIM